MSDDKGNGKGEVIHVKKFADGRETPDEMHRRLGINKKCVTCGKPAAIRIRVLMPLDELTKRQPEYVAVIMATNPDGPFVPTIPTTYGPMVRISDVGACDLCKSEAEKAAAKHPSWAVVEIDRGPGYSRLVTQVPDKLEAKA